MQESRVSIRLLLLKVFGMLCGLDSTVIGVLLTSVLPNELGRDIQQGLKGGRGWTWDMTKLDLYESRYWDENLFIL